MALKPVTIKLAVTIDGMDSEKVRVQREPCDPATIAATLVVGSGGDSDLYRHRQGSD